MAKMRPITTGNYLRERGIRPGPIYREVLDSLRDAWIDGNLTSEKQEKALLETLLENACT